MKATLKNYRQAPRKVRLVADTVRGRNINEAMTALSFLGKRAASHLQKLIKSAAANAKNTGHDEKSLFIKEITVDKGHTFKRHRARARGRSSPIRKETSHISIVLGESIEENKKSRSK